MDRPIPDPEPDYVMRRNPPPPASDVGGLERKGYGGPWEIIIVLGLFSAVILYWVSL